jgi:serine protease
MIHSLQIVIAIWLCRFLLAASELYGPWVVLFDETIDHAFFRTTVTLFYALLPEKSGTFSILSEYRALFHGIGVLGLTEDQLLSIFGVTEVLDASQNFTIDAYNWGTDRIDQSSLPLDNAAYNPDFDGSGVDCYIIDTGLDTEHIEFADIGKNREVANVFDAFSPDGVILPNNDQQGHGTHVAGTMGGNTIGVSNGCNVYGVKVLSDAGPSALTSVIDGMEFVASRHKNNPGARSVVNMSLGAGCGSDGCVGSAQSRGVDELVKAGIIVVTSAGNSYANACFFSPASVPLAITVGASSITDDPSDFSNFGECVDIWAPGMYVDIEVQWCMFIHQRNSSFELTQCLS